MKTNKYIVKKDSQLFVSLGAASEMTLGNGCTSFENFGSKYCNCH